MKYTKFKKQIPMIILLIALALAAAACDAVEAQTQNTPTTALGGSKAQVDSRLNADLSAPETVPLCDPVELEFRVTNQSDQTLYLLTWYTPLEGILGNIFRVTHDGQELSYLGPMVMRAAPLAEQYGMLEPGESATAVVDISKVYDFSQEGVYTIAFKSPQISHAVEDMSEFAASVAELGPVQISSQEIEVEIVAPKNGEGDCAASADAPPAAPDQKNDPDFTLSTLTGIVKHVSPSARIIWLQEELDGFTTIALTADGMVSTASGKSLRLNPIQQGLTVKASGRPGDHQVFLACSVQVIPPEGKSE